jgi:predicted metal-dependent phosphoesterase TrpH
MSDGSMSIENLILLAKKQGLTTISIADQDSAGALGRAQIIGKRYGVDVLPGIEFSSTDPSTGREIHILCYLGEVLDRLAGLCHANVSKRKIAGMRMLSKLMQRFQVNEKLVEEYSKSSSCIYPQHLMHVLVECGYTDRIFGSLYEELFNPESENNIYVTAHFPSPKDVIDAIHQAGGVAVLAHPSVCEVCNMVDELLSYGLDGVEVFHTSNTRDDQKNLLALAKSENILVTGGSDFRGIYSNPSVTMGQEQVNDAQINSLLTYKSRLRRARRQTTAV